MANNFKSDESFLRKLAIGAAGTNATMACLKNFGFNPIELERGSTGFKIWKKIKIKRVRVPDILCLKTGLRFESRGKTKLEISMSHSKNDPKRTWDAGMRADDFVSIVQFEQHLDSPINVTQVSPVHFIRVSDLNDAFIKNKVKMSQPKGVEEGSEIRVIWTSAIANDDSIVESVLDTKIVLSPLSGGRKQTVQLIRNKGLISLAPLVIEKSRVEKNQIIAAIIPVTTSISCPAAVNESYFVEKLSSVNLSERYAAAKALRYRGYTNAAPSLFKRMNDPDEDIYVQLEAAAALAAHGDSAAWTFLASKLNKPAIEVPLETQLETIIVASEIADGKSEQLLINVLRDTRCDDELRAGAAWALGQFPSQRSADALSDTFDSTPVDIKIEAARALLRIAPSQAEHLVTLMQDVDCAKRDGLAWVLARIGSFDPLTLASTEDINLRQWVAYIVGYGKEKFQNEKIEELCRHDAEIYFAASVLWQIISSWIHELKEY